MVRPQPCILFLCLLTAFASSAFAQPSVNHRCDTTMETAKNWLAKFDPTAPNAEQTFQEKKLLFDQWVDYCSKWGHRWTQPFAFELPKKSATPPQPAPQQTTSSQPTPPKQPNSPNLNDRMVQQTKLPELSKPAQQTTPAPKAEPPLTPLKLLSTPSGYLLLFLLFAYPAVYWLLCKHVIKFRAQGLPQYILESVAFFLLAAFLFEVTGGSPVIIILLAVCFAIALWRGLEATQKKKAEQAAAALKAKQETLTELRRLLDPLHVMYGRYAEVSEFIPASWYEPRKPYIEYMADLLYATHARETPFYLSQHNITPDSHPLYILRHLSFPDTALAKDERFSDPNHPYNVITSAITDPNDRNHIVFQKLVPLYARLLPYLKSKRWEPALNAEADQLAGLVEQEMGIRERRNRKLG